MNTAAAPLKPRTPRLFIVRWVRADGLETRQHGGDLGGGAVTAAETQPPAAAIPHFDPNQGATP